MGALSLKAGDLAIIQSIPDVLASMAGNPAQAARIRAWVGKTVMITGQSPEGGLWFKPVGPAAAPDDPRFCLRSGDLVKVRTHL